MRIKLLLCFIIMGFLAKAQHGENIFHPFLLNNDSFNGIQLGAEVELGSSSLNFGMMQNFLFADRFNQDYKQQFINSSYDRTNLQLNFQTKITYHIADEHSSALTLDFNNLTYYSTASSIAKIGLFGNKQYAGSELKSSQNRVSNFAYSRINYSKTIKNKDSWFLSANCGLTLLYTYRSASINELVLETEMDGEFIDVVIDRGNFALQEAGLDGIGVHAGFKLGYQWKEQHYIGFELNDLGTNLLLNTTEYAVDTSFRFEGVVIDFSNLQSGGYDNLLDSIEQNSLYADSSSKAWVSIPVNSHLYYQRPINSEQALSVSLRSRDYGYYGYSIQLGHHLKKRKFTLLSALHYGNFSGWNLNANVQFKPFKTWQCDFGVMGVGSWLAPKNLSYSGFRLGVAKAL